MASFAETQVLYTAHAVALSGCRHSRAHWAEAALERLGTPTHRIAPRSLYPRSPQILEGLIKFRWKTLPTEQREGIRTYLVQKIITVRGLTPLR